MVIIFLCMTAESSFFMRLMFPAHWNFSELMKKMGCLTRGKISSSKGDIQASSAMPHLIEKGRLLQNTEMIQLNIYIEDWVLFEIGVGDLAHR